MSAKKWAALILVFCLGFSMAPGVYAIPECGMGVNAAPMRMEGCGGGSGCCGCEMDSALPQVDFGGDESIAPSRLSLDVYFEETIHPKNSFQLPEGPLSPDSREERSSHPSKLYDLYSDYRV